MAKFAFRESPKIFINISVCKSSKIGSLEFTFVHSINVNKNILFWQKCAFLAKKKSILRNSQISPNFLV